MPNSDPTQSGTVVCVKCGANLPHPGVRECLGCGWLWPARRSPPRHVKRMVIARQNGLCAVCGEPEPSLTIDHIVALADGGTHRARNLQALCDTCHKAKHA